jgi:hypothetical protein
MLPPSLGSGVRLKARGKWPSSSWKIDLRRGLRAGWAASCGCSTTSDALFIAAGGGGGGGGDAGHSPAATYQVVALGNAP